VARAWSDTGEHALDDAAAGVGALDAEAPGAAVGREAAGEDLAADVDEGAGEAEVLEAGGDAVGGVAGGDGGELEAQGRGVLLQGAGGEVEGEVLPADDEGVELGLGGLGGAGVATPGAEAPGGDEGGDGDVEGAVAGGADLVGGLHDGEEGGRGGEGGGVRVGVEARYLRVGAPGRHLAVDLGELLGDDGLDAALLGLAERGDHGDLVGRAHGRAAEGERRGDGGALLLEAGRTRPHAPGAEGDEADEQEREQDLRPAPVLVPQRVRHQPPKSSIMMFSGSTPRSMSILVTATFIIGGPQM
jgi:hypothetical protein